MGHTRRQFMVLAGAAASGIGMPTVLRAQGTIQLRIAHGTSAQSSYAKATRHFGDRLRELTGGRITVREFGGGTLGTETTTLDLYDAGDIDMGFHFTSAMAPAVKRLGFLDVPFLFQGMDHWKTFAYSPEFKSIFNGYLEAERKPYRAAVIGLSGSRNVYTRNVVIDSIDKFNGLKLRLPESAVAAKLWRALGAIPTAVPWPDVYTAIETGLVQGAENTPNWYLDARHIEVAKNYHFTNHLIGTAIMLVGTGTLKKIPADLMPKFEQALAETSDFWLKTQIEADESAIKNEFEKQHVKQHHISKEILAGIRERAAPLKAETAAEFNVADLLALIEKTA
ncbi:hypothetical protein AA309_04460 [Microvirga vignae]|uniref:C4-dicarboxylate ABC transporter substrate-binding protein n=1 Tax=Microvirga vignae TaxID=1225564 RepID=A0A0H1RHA9_9HYPH|nr:TRAP transporter substrate-binding protein [Microvirga vignae]KLK94216.1 hypothetical protein AA309_04460 [Microvirga vignae]